MILILEVFLESIQIALSSRKNFRLFFLEFHAVIPLSRLWEQRYLFGSRYSF